MERALAHGARPTLVGTEPGALLAGATIVLALHERGRDVALATLSDDPLAAPLAAALEARGLPSAIVQCPDVSTLEAPVALGSGRVLEETSLLEALAARSHARVALVGLGSEACQGIDPASVRRALAAHLAGGALIDRTPLFPLDPLCRSWLELVEDVHHAVGPAAQRPIADAVRAALFGRHGEVVVDLAARERPAHVSLDTASIIWLDPQRMR